MNFSIARQIMIRITVLVGIFLICTVGIYFLGLPKPWAWAAMLTMLSWTTFVSKLI